MNEMQLSLVPDGTQEQAQAMGLHYEIVAAAQTAANSLLDLGRKLKQMRDTGGYKRLGFETFAQYTEQAVGIRQRQAEGIAAAKARGVQFGRPSKPLPENFYAVHRTWRSGQITLRQAAELCHMNHNTFYYRARRYEDEQRAQLMVRDEVPRTGHPPAEGGSPPSAREEGEGSRNI